MRKFGENNKARVLQDIRFLIRDDFFALFSNGSVINQGEILLGIQYV